jgi:Mandelate racemase / muconate lactonizing enzyme, N-terminal domain
MVRPPDRGSAGRTSTLLPTNDLRPDRQPPRIFFHPIAARRGTPQTRVCHDCPVGSSYVFCYTALALKPTALLLQGLAPMLVGQPVAPLELERHLAGRFRLLGAQGLTGIALSAIDMAAWDALARASDRQTR